MLNKWDQARLMGFKGTRIEFILDEYKKGGIEQARDAGFDGEEQELKDLLPVATPEIIKFLKGTPGLNAFDHAVIAGFTGTEKEWLDSLQGKNGLTAYEIALAHGFEGSEELWVKALDGADGMSAYEVWLMMGNIGDEQDFLDSLKGLKGDKGEDGKTPTQAEIITIVQAILATMELKGEKGDVPNHQVENNRIRFEKPDGKWGEWITFGNNAIGSGGGGSISIQKFYDDVASFPSVGKSQILYFDKSTSPYGVYVWDGTAYQQVGGGGGGGTAYTVAVQGKNTSGALIPKGTPVMATGTLGASGIITIAPMNGTNPDNYKYLIGVTGADIAVDATGDVVDLGKIRGIDTTEWAEGDVLWISTTAIGEFTNVEPTSGLKMPVAFVVTDHHVNGEIMVRVTPIDENGFVGQSFETVAKNLDASNAVFNYSSGDLATIVYSNGVTKTMTYTSGDLTKITLSGSTPNGITLNKNLSYDGSGDLVGVTYD